MHGDARAKRLESEAGVQHDVVVVDRTPACDDGVDDDGDGSVDLADAQCASAADPTERACGLGFEIAFVIAPLAVARARRRVTRTRP